MLQQNPAQQQVYQPSRRRVKRRVAAKPSVQHATPMNKTDVSFAAVIVKLIVVLFLAYIIIPMEWLQK
ncbi:MAG: hypothetical protein BWK73_49770 [Thiothrix lacustris]|uniref:Uncharacterized protein n=1 Tax=Thiothrix lacustris TaxID=525917 RepID=A0A1Y1Q8R4_9GAMM|nr:MAG: hypothetical protein BWK73_49770 [Thiothrix lacustris]